MMGWLVPARPPHPPRRSTASMGAQPPRRPLWLQLLVRHGSYNPVTFANDIALLLLAWNSETTPVPMAPANYRLSAVDSIGRGDWLWVAGIGKDESEEPTMVLM